MGVDAVTLYIDEMIMVVFFKLLLKWLIRSFLQRVVVPCILEPPLIS